MISPREALRLANSTRPCELSEYIRLGGDLAEPGFVMMYRECLGRETHTKMVLTADGDCSTTTQPVSVYLCTSKWRVWDLGHDSLYVGYDPSSKNVNRWWADLRQRLGSKLGNRVPAMYGDLVLFRPCDNLLWNELELRRELINFAVSRFLHCRGYNFSFKIE
jgi:hypothetical protein